jgi:hypothetical protein
MRYTFNKHFTLTKEMLEAQLESVKKLLSKDSAAWADTVPPDHVFDDDDLDEIKKIERK